MASPYAAGYAEANADAKQSYAFASLCGMTVLLVLSLLTTVSVAHMSFSYSNIISIVFFSLTIIIGCVGTIQRRYKLVLTYVLLLLATVLVSAAVSAAYTAHLTSSYSTFKREVCENEANLTDQECKDQFSNTNLVWVPIGVGIAVNICYFACYIACAYTYAAALKQVEQYAPVMGGAPPAYGATGAPQGQSYQVV